MISLLSCLLLLLPVSLIYGQNCQDCGDDFDTVSQYCHAPIYVSDSVVPVVILNCLNTPQHFLGLSVNSITSLNTITRILEHSVVKPHWFARGQSGPIRVENTWQGPIFCHTDTDTDTDNWIHCVLCWLLTSGGRLCYVFSCWRRAGDWLSLSAFWLTVSHSHFTLPSPQFIRSHLTLTLRTRITRVNKKPL